VGGVCWYATRKKKNGSMSSRSSAYGGENYTLPDDKSLLGSAGPTPREKETNVQARESVDA
jgi:hypothetical protein